MKARSASPDPAPAPKRKPSGPAVRRPPASAYPFDGVPETGTAREIRPGVLWIRMPLPFVLNHINLYALEDGDGWTIIDTGTRTEATATAWQQLLPGALGGRPIRRVLATHMHPDHVGMAGWLTRKFACRLWITRLEYIICRMLVADTGNEAPDDGVDFYRRAGWDETALEHYRARFGSFGKGIYRLPDSYRRIRHGETIRIGEHDWTVVVGHGHSPEHACLHCPSLKLFISGDQVLPRITSNVSVFPTEPDADPLGDWMESLAQLERAVPDDVLVLPSHNEPFVGLHARLRALATGHLRNLERLRRSLAKPRRVIDLFGALFARQIGNDSYLLSMATGECIAHLNYLKVRGELSVETDAQGVDWYRAN